MYTYYYRNHHRHDPGILPQPAGGSPHYYSEVAARGLLIWEAVDRAGLGPILDPQDWGLAPLVRVHSAKMIHFLCHAYRQWVEGEGKPPVLIPETFAVGGMRRSAFQSLSAQAGYYCYDTSSPIFEHTWDAVYWAAQCAVSAAAHVLETGTPAYALCRPPGHHAGHQRYGGFCYLNNAAIAAQWLADRGRRTAVVDVDYHHGNGTQALFYARADVLFCSVHADPDMEYPYYWGYVGERGIGEGEGFNHNFPLAPGIDEWGYMDALDAALRRVRAFAPDILILSLGVDSYEGDPVGGFALKTESFARMASRFAALRLPAVAIQEGGYARTELGANVVAFLEPLAG